MRSPLIAAAAVAAMLAPALAVKSPVPVSFGYNKSLNFTLDENNDMTSGTASDMDRPAGGKPPSRHFRPHMKLAGDVSLHTPPVFNHEGDCCRPTAQCHAYFKWVIDMINPTPQWDSDDQKAEAMAHLDCCMRQYRASCANPPVESTVVWRDPARGCSNGPLLSDVAVPAEDGEKWAQGLPGPLGALGGLPGPVVPENVDALEVPKVDDEVKVDNEVKVDDENKADGEVKEDDKVKRDDPESKISSGFWLFNAVREAVQKLNADKQTNEAGKQN